MEGMDREGAFAAEQTGRIVGFIEGERAQVPTPTSELLLQAQTMGEALAARKQGVLERVTALEARLGPVLRPADDTAPSPSPIASAPMPRMTPTTAAFAEVYDEIERIDYLAYRLDALLARLVV